MEIAVVVFSFIITVTLVCICIPFAIALEEFYYNKRLVNYYNITTLNPEKEDSNGFKWNFKKIQIDSGELV